MIQIPDFIQNFVHNKILKDRNLYLMYLEGLELSNEEQQIVLRDIIYMYTGDHITYDNLDDYETHIMLLGPEDKKKKKKIVEEKEKKDNKPRKQTPLTQILRLAMRQHAPKGYLHNDEKEHIWKLHNDGLSSMQISIRTGRPASTVKRVIRQDT